MLSGMRISRRPHADAARERRPGNTHARRPTGDGTDHARAGHRGHHRHQTPARGTTGPGTTRTDAGITRASADRTRSITLGSAAANSSTRTRLRNGWLGWVASSEGQAE